VRVVRRVQEAEVVAEFLRAEWESPRFGEALRALAPDEALVTAPRLDDERENAARAQLLDEHRGWLRRVGLFSGLPRQIDWLAVTFAREELLDILYIDWDWWLELSGGSRRPRDAARLVRAREDPASIAAWNEPILESRARLIAVTDPQRSRVVLIEGHVRLTAYALYPERVADEVEVLLGTADDIACWSVF
jgi:hypothetical protein